MEAAAHIIYAEPENDAVVNGGRRRIKGASRTQWIFAALSALVLGWIIFNSTQQSRSSSDIFANGIDTLGEVIDQHTTGGKTRIYYLTYRYTANGRAYENEESVGSDDYDAFPVGTRVTVRYLKANPLEARLLGLTPPNLIEKIVPVIFVVLGLSVIVYPLIVTFQRIRLSRGQILDGRLIEVRGQDVQNQGFRVTFEYAFRSPPGVELTGKRALTRNDLRANPLPEAGSQVKVLYLNDKTHRML